MKVWFFAIEYCPWFLFFYFWPKDCCVCLATGFVTDYPPELQNIISPNEFKQSITNINQHFPKSFYSRLSFASIFIAIASALIVIGCVFLFLGITNRLGEITPIPSKSIKPRVSCYSGKTKEVDRNFLVSKRLCFTRWQNTLKMVLDRKKRCRRGC
jgi:hypothetical protein